MKTLYEAGNALEAHMLLDLLKQQGLSPRLHGEYLSGAIGELPAAGLVRLVIEDDEYDGARAFIDEWSAAQPADVAPSPVVQRQGLLNVFILGIALGAAVMYVLLRGLP